MATQFEADLSDHELDSMEQRSLAATPGPWISFVVGRDLEAGLHCIEVGYCSAIEVLGATVADQDFIASAREDVPRLIDEVRRLRAQMRMHTLVMSAQSMRPLPAASTVESATC